MKDKMLIILIALFILIPTVNAEQCNVVTGDGTKLGDEISCGTEHFYVLKNDGKRVKMLAKYNLYAGYILHEKGGYATTDDGYNELEEYDYATCWYESEAEDSLAKCIYAESITVDTMKQDSKAIGAYGEEKENPRYPQVGVTYLTDYADFKYNINNDLDLSTTKIYDYILGYEDTLKGFGIKPEKVAILTLDDLLYVLNTINGTNGSWEDLDFKSDWIEEWDYFYTLSMLNVIPKQYSWIYQTTYWLGTVNGTSLFFIDTLGDLCTTDACYDQVELGAGVRPVVTISTNDLFYEPPVEDKKDDDDKKDEPIENPETGVYTNLSFLPIGIVSGLGLIYTKKYRLFRKL